MCVSTTHLIGCEHIELRICWTPELFYCSHSSSTKGHWVLPYLQISQECCNRVRTCFDVSCEFDSGSFACAFLISCALMLEVQDWEKRRKSTIAHILACHLEVSSWLILTERNCIWTWGRRCWEAWDVEPKKTLVEEMLRLGHSPM